MKIKIIRIYDKKFSFNLFKLNKFCHLKKAFGIKELQNIFTLSISRISSFLRPCHNVFCKSSST